jgi:hypothetical protein
MDPSSVGSGSFIQIWILERSMAICSQLDLKLKQNPPDLRTLILHLWMLCSMDLSFKMADLQMEKSVRKS